MLSQRGSEPNEEPDATGGDGGPAHAVGTGASPDAPGDPDDTRATVDGTGTGTGTGTDDGDGEPADTPHRSGRPAGDTGRAGSRWHVRREPLRLRRVRRRLVRIVRVRWRLARRRWHGMSRRGRLGTVAATTLVVALVAVGIPVGLSLASANPTEAHESPQDLVAGYLDAIRGKDIDTALELAERQVADGAERYLRAEAVADAWTVSELSTTQDGDRATVTARLDHDSESVDADFALLETSDGAWHLVDPFATVEFGQSPLDYRQVNGYRDIAGGDETRYPLLPGFYAFGADNPAADVTGTAGFAVPGETLSVTVDVAVTDDGLAAAKEAVNTFIDDCADSAPTDTGYVTACPFSGGRGMGDLVGYQYMYDFADVKWTVDEYPSISVEPAGHVFKVSDEEVGSITFSAVGTEEEWHQGEGFTPLADHDVSADCQIQARWLELRLSADGTWTVRYYTDADSIDDYRPGTFIDTCIAAT